MKKGLFFVLALFGFGLVMTAEYATGSNGLVDFLGNIIRWFRTTYLDVKNTAGDTVSHVTGQQNDGPDAMSIALPIIAKFEGFVGHAYLDVAGVWTIGYGHAIRPGDGFNKDKSQLISESDAWAQLEIDAQSAARCVEANVQAELTVQQKAALISFVFNLGCGAFTGSTLLQKINEGDFDGAAAQFPRWIYAGGKVFNALVTRRQDEAALFQSGTVA